jgi:hypothetical protein
MQWILIKPENKLPDDFLDMGAYNINRDKYVLEAGHEKENYWQDEYLSPITLEMVGAIMIGSKMYCDFRYRERTSEDKPWNKYDTLIAKIYQSTFKQKA